jgi:hypothetical protein
MQFNCNIFQELANLDRPAMAGHPWVVRGVWEVRLPTIFPGSLGLICQHAAAAAGFISLQIWRVDSAETLMDA